jgi:SH3 domain-containing protein
MKSRAITLALVLAFGHGSPAVAQSDEIKLDPAEPKITTVSAMRLRKAPQITAEQMLRLKLGTVVTAVARSSNQDTVGDKTDYWYRVNLSNGQSGWLFGGLLLDYTAARRQELLRQIVDARLKAENTDFPDRQEIYNLAASSVKEAKDLNTRAEFELLQLLALAGSARAFRDDLQDKSPYREWLKAHEVQVIPNEFGGAYNLRSELLWNLEKKYHMLPIADRIAWEAAQNPRPSDCEGDEVCHFFIAEPAVKYLSLHPNGTHAAEALNFLTESFTDEVIRRANDKGGDQYAVEERANLRKVFAALRLALTKISAPGKTELLKKLQRITSRR